MEQTSPPATSCLFSQFPLLFLVVVAGYPMVDVARHAHSCEYQEVESYEMDLKIAFIHFSSLFPTLFWPSSRTPIYGGGDQRPEQPDSGPISLLSFFSFLTNPLFSFSTGDCAATTRAGFHRQQVRILR